MQAKLLASRITHHASRITHHASRITHHALKHYFLLLILLLIPLKAMFAQDFPCQCPDPNDFTNIGASGTTTYLSSLNFNGSPPTGCLAIAGTFVIDELFAASNTTFVMQPGSKIVVAYPGGSGDIAFSNNYFYSCQNMWQGITVKNNASFVFENNTIEDAQYAITARQNTTLRIIGNTFHKDWVGVFINPDGQSVSIPKGFYDNHFTCGNDNLLPPYSGQSPDPGDKTFAGVYILNAAYFAVGLPNDPTSVNYMDGIRNGIIAHQATTGVYHQDIQNLIGSSNPSSVPIESLSGIAIYAKECPELRARYNNIQNAYIGLYSSFSSAKIKDNDVHVNRWGTFIGKASNKYIELTGNNITLSSNFPPAAKIGIVIDNAEHYEHLDISSNTISILDIGTQAYLARAIYLHDCFPANDATINQVSNNSIDISEDAHVIELNDAKDIPVFSNLVQVSFAENLDFHAGIRLVTSHNCRVRDNTLIGIDPLQNSPRNGIELLYSPSTLLCCNDLDEFRTGISINGICNNSSIATTQFHTHYYGIYYLDDATMVGMQDHTGNEWHENCTSWDIKGNNVLPYNKYFVDETQQPFDWTPPDFVNVENGPTPNCSTWPTCGEEWPYPLLTALDSTIASGSLGNLPYSNYTTWMAEQELYRKLSENSSLWQLNSLMSAFKAQRDTADIGSLYPLRLAIDTAWQYDPTLDQQMQSLYTQISDKADQVDSLYEAFPGNNASDSLAILQQISSLLSDIRSLKNTWWTNDSTFVQNILNNALPQIASENQNVQVSFQPAVNERDFNSYLLQYWQNENVLDSAALSGLYSLASQCHYTGGTAVLRARSLYEFAQDSIIDWDAIEICKTSKKGNTGKTQTSVTYAKIKVFPNPADASVSIQISKDTWQQNEAPNYQISDLQGKVWQNGKTSSKVFDLDVSKLPPGAYLLSFTSKEGEVIAREKILVVH